MDRSKSAKVLISCICLFLLTSSAICQGASLPYDQNWQVVFGGWGTGTFRRAFGEAATANGDSFGLDAETAVCRAEAIADAGLLGISNASATVNFTRQFTLPPGFMYKLTLTASLKGEQYTQDFGDHAIVSSASAIGTVQGPAFLMVDDNDNGLFTNTLSVDDFTLPIFTGSVTKSTAGFIVAPGVYEVRGFLNVSADTPNGDIGLDAKSNFFNDSSFGFRVTAEVEAIALSGCVRDGDPAFFVGFTYGPHQVIRGETWCDDIAPANFGFVSATCPGDDTFCNHYSDLLGWAISSGAAPNNECYELGSGSYFWCDICITVPCDALIGATNTLTAIMAYCNVDGVCNPGCEDCEDPNYYGGDPYYSTTSTDFVVIESPPALSILQDSLYYAEQGQTAAYIPFSICNGDPCAPATDYGYAITTTGYISAVTGAAGTALGIPGGDFKEIYGIIDAGSAEVCDYDTLTIIAWDLATGTVYDTCVQVVHVIEPVPVPLFTTPATIILILALILSTAVLIKKRIVEA